jgi:hypothetical protein
MADTIDGGPDQVATHRACGPDMAGVQPDPGITQDPGTAEAASQAGTEAAAARDQRPPRQVLRDLRSDEPVYVQWILQLPLGAPLRALYKDHVTAYDRDMAAYFDNSKYLADDDRWLARESFLSMIRQINAYQAWLFVADRFRDVVVSVAELPSWFVFAVATCVAAWTPTPLAIKIACLLLSGLLILMVFALDLQSLDLDDPRRPGQDGHIRWLKRPRLRDVVAACVSAQLST